MCEILFADVFVYVGESEEQLETKSAVMVFAKEGAERTWKGGEYHQPTVAKYTYLGIHYAPNGAWNEHMYKDVREWQEG